MFKVRGEWDFNLAQRMRVVGVPLDRDEFEERLIVHQDPHVGSVALRYLIDLYTTIQLYVVIASNSRIPLRLCGVQVSLLWTNIPVELLQDPADPFAPQTYRFPGQTSGGFDKSDIIVQSGKTLTRGQSVEGFLLGYDADPIPQSIRHGSEVPVVLTIEDQFRGTYNKELFAKIDRSAEWGPKPKSARSRRNLFDKPDSSKTRQFAGRLY